VECARELIGKSPATPPKAAKTPAEAASVKAQLTCAHRGSARLRLLAVIQPIRAATKPAPKPDSS